MPMSVRFVLLVLFSFLMPVLFWPRSTSYEAIKLTFLAVTAAALLGVLAWSARRQKTLTFQLNWLHTTGLAVLIIGLVTLPWALTPALAGQAILLVFFWLILASVFSVEITSYHRLVIILRAALLGCVVAALYGLLQIARLLSGPGESGALLGISSLGNQNYLAGLLGVAFFPSLVLWRAGGRLAKVMAVAASAVILVTALVCNAMGPILALIAVGSPLAAALLLIRRGRSRLVPRWYGVCLAAGLVALVVGWALALQVPAVTEDGRRGRANPVRRLYNSNSGDMRLTDWTVGLKMLQDRPLTGVGMNNYKVGWPRYRSQLVRRPDGPDWAIHAPRATKTHNEYIQFAAETGAGGGLILLLAGGMALLHFRRRFLQLQDGHRQQDYLLLLAGVGVAAAHAMVSFPVHLPATVGLLALLIGALESPSFAEVAAVKATLQREAAHAQGDKAGRVLRLPWHPAASVVLLLLALLVMFGAVREFRADLKQRRGIEFYRAGYYQSAQALLTQATAARWWPGDGLFYLAMTRAATRGSENASRGDRTTGRERQQAGEQQDEIVAALQRSLQYEPTFEAHLHLAEELRDQGRFAEALANLAVVNGCEPTVRLHRESHFLRATIALREGEAAQARALLDSLLVEAPHHHRAWIAYGYLEALTGDPEAAQQRYQQALRIIDERIQTLASLPPAEVAGRLARLRQHRLTTERALASLAGASP